jgi:DEAD/DEAH box helicase domain-containing protein
MASRSDFCCVLPRRLRAREIPIVALPIAASESAAAPVKNIVYFDLETQKSAEEVGGWHRIQEMRMSVGVTYSTRRGGYRIYHERHIDSLIEELRRADLVVGFNHLRFDFEVLHGYTVLDLTQVPSLDLLIELQKQLNHRLTLDGVAGATLGTEKTSDGLQALRWFREGRFMDIAEYCCYDVKITRLLHEFGRHWRRLFYTNRNGQRLPVPVGW